VIRQEAEKEDEERESLNARACTWGATDGGMVRRREESGPSARRDGHMPRTRRRSGSADDGEDEDTEVG
jgi:hypothetical protein